jgi:hypothetical protein
MRAAGAEVRECRRVLEKGGLNVVGEVLRGQGEFVEFDHYPADDVFDAGNAVAVLLPRPPRCRGRARPLPHLPARARHAGGHGPVPYAGAEPWPAGDEALSHLVAISMDAYGESIGLFTVNRWVTGDAWYAAGRRHPHARSLRHRPRQPVLAGEPLDHAMLRLFRPQIEALILARDAALADWARGHPGQDVFEDRELEITSQAAISVEEQIAAVEAALKGA